MAYIGTRPCGCVTFWMVDDGDPSIPERLAEVEASGRRVERVPSYEGAQRLTAYCPHRKVAA